MNDNTLSNKEVKKMMDNPFKIPREAKAARVIQVIETVTLAGDGTDANPVYEVFQYWPLDGKLLARSDSLNPCDAHLASLDQ